MKAIIWTAYGPPDVLQLQDIPKPSPKPDQVLIKVHAASVSAGDCEARRLDFPFGLSLPMRLFVGFSRPTRIRILGQEFSGVIEEVGSAVSTWKPGDAVFGTTGFRFGAYAEYLCLPAVPSDGDGVFIHKPGHLSFKEAAALPVGGFESLHFMRAAHANPGMSMLINGAGGSIGTLALQLAKNAGLEVTAVDNGSKLDMLRDLGADQVLNYRETDFTRQGKTYDTILDVVGKAPFSRAVHVLNPQGKFLIANPSFAKIVRALWVNGLTGKQVYMKTAAHTAGDLQKLAELCAKKIIHPVVGHVFPLSQAADAHRLIEDGGKKGALILKVVD